MRWSRYIPKGSSVKIQRARISGHFHCLAVLQSAGSSSPDCKQHLSVSPRDCLLLMFRRRHSIQRYHRSFSRATNTGRQMPHHSNELEEVSYISNIRGSDCVQYAYTKCGLSPACRYSTGLIEHPVLQTQIANCSAQCSTSHQPHTYQFNAVRRCSSLLREFSCDHGTRTDLAVMPRGQHHGFRIFDGLP